MKILTTKDILQTIVRLGGKVRTGSPLLIKTKEMPEQNKRELELLLKRTKRFQFLIRNLGG